ncbi:hypothetical protein ACCO45_000138 [Purpureocillium lilacinum]|uniref:Uncharacterized protein n=1 Tax=Purpureocillium lilacinum TaxID=33203 RepID=A0ACC4E5W2_PURLI
MGLAPNPTSRHAPQGPAGTDYHLSIKGFSPFENTAAVARVLIEQFLFELFGRDGPIACSQHNIPDGETWSVLQVRSMSIKLSEGDMKRADPIQLSFRAKNGDMLIDDVLRLFCSRFFAQSDHGAAQTLSRFGMYGFTPSEENMKLAWYQELFTWMGTHRAAKLKNMSDYIRALEEGQSVLSWWPTGSNWIGVLILAASIGMTYSSYEGGPVNTALMATADGLLLYIANIFRFQAASTEAAAEEHWVVANAACNNFTDQTANIIGLVRSQHGADEELHAAHRSMTREFVGLLEEGFTTVTVCHAAAQAYVTVKQAYAVGTIALGVTFALSTANAWHYTSSLMESGYQPTSAVGLVLSAIAAIHGASQTYGAARKAQEAALQQQKWSAAAQSVAVIVRHAQRCEVHLRWAYNTGGVGAESADYRLAFEAMLREMASALPSAEQTTPQAIQDRLLQYASVMEREVIGLRAVLRQ